MTTGPQRHVLVWPESGVAMAFRLIPAGVFRMGSRGENPAEEPVHRVRIAEPFWMGETPVTQAQFALWTQAEKIEHENHFKDRPDHPSENMDWRQATAYCAWLSRVKAAELPDGFTLACLPTEAEWEYACRAGTDTEYYTGDGATALTEAGWFGEDWETAHHAVRQKSPNAFGLYDMHGNVWEWCHDVWDEKAYRALVDDEADPCLLSRLDEWRTGLDAMTASNQLRVMRGGSWGNSAWSCRSAFRGRVRPGDRFGDYGFRLCLARGPAGQPGTEAEPATGDGGRGTRPQSHGAGDAAGAASDLSRANLPRVAGRKIPEKL